MHSEDALEAAASETLHDLSGRLGKTAGKYGFALERERESVRDCFERRCLIGVTIAEFK